MSSSYVFVIKLHILRAKLQNFNQLSCASYVIHPKQDLYFGAERSADVRNQIMHFTLHLT